MSVVHPLHEVNAPKLKFIQAFDGLKVPAFLSFKQIEFLALLVSFLLFFYFTEPLFNRMHTPLISNLTFFIDQKVIQS